MRTVRVAQRFDGTVSDAERCWYDTTRWSHWVDGLDEVVSVDADWPRTGASVRWRSGPAGRGTVLERAVFHEPLTGQTLEVQDDSIRGRQSVTFTPDDPGVEVALTLEYELLRRSLVSPIVDALFIKRAMAASLAVTMTRFGAELDSARTRRGADNT